MAANGNEYIGASPQTLTITHFFKNSAIRRTFFNRKVFFMTHTNTINGR